MRYSQWEDSRQISVSIILKSHDLEVAYKLETDSETSSEMVADLSDINIYFGNNTKIERLMVE